MFERTGEAFEFDEKLTIQGKKLQVGDPAPDFELKHFDPNGGGMQTVRLSDTNGKVRLISVINSIDTPVCSVETHKWEQEIPTLPEDVVVYTISMDLPFALLRWNQAENVNHDGLSAHQNEQFARDYGVLIKEWRMLQRATFVIDRNNTIVHADYVSDQMNEPNYGTAVEAARKAAGQ